MIDKLINVVESAGVKMLEFYNNKETNVKYKGEIDLVTEYDEELERLLTKSLNKAFPDFTIVGEESSSPDTGLLDGKIIYVDPIDGTTSFVHRFPMTCISVSMYINKQAHCGVVHNPMLGETYSAKKGFGSRLNGKKINVSSVDKPIHSLFATGFAYDKKERLASVPLLYHMLDITQGVRRTGSAALDLCYVAKGTFELYYETNLKPWDMGAGILIVEEAGGKVTDGAGQPHDLSSKMVVATNGLLHDEFLKQLEIGKS